MIDNNPIIPIFLNRIEDILDTKCKNLNTPQLSHDLSFVLIAAVNYKYSKDEKYKLICLQYIDNLLECFDEIEFGVGFLENFEGIIWLFTYLQKNNIIEDDSQFKDLIPFLYKSIEQDIFSNNFDLLHGAIVKIQTVINYHGSNDQTTVKYLNLFIDKLYESRIQKENCIFWYDELYDNNSRGVNLGYAHGIPSLLVFLLRIKSFNYNHTHLITLIDGTINSLLRFSYKNRTECSFPAVFREIDSENTMDSSRMSFCYGDLGVAFSLLLASKILNREALFNFSEKVVRKICYRTITNSSIMHYDKHHFIDTSFCHGISGILFMLMRINKFIDNELLTNRIGYWKQELFYNLNIQLNIEGPIVFPFLNNSKEGEDDYIIDEECILMGYSGTALVLLSLMYDKDDWSEMFLLNTLSTLKTT